MRRTLNATARKVAAGAAETTPVVTVTNLARTLELLKEAGCGSSGADAERAADGRRGGPDGRPVLVMGAEGAGLRQLTRQTLRLAGAAAAAGRRWRA